MKRPSGPATVLIVTSTFPRWRGDTMPAFVHGLATTLARRGVVHVLAPHAAGAKSREELDGVHVHRFRYAPARFEGIAYGAGIANNLRRSPWLALWLPFYLLAETAWLVALAIRHRVEVVNVHWIFPFGLLAWPWKRWLGYRLVLTSHGGDLFVVPRLRPKALMRRLLSVAVRHADHVTVVSSALEHELRTRIPDVPAALPVTVIPMGVDVSRFATVERSGEGRASGAPLLGLSVGRLTEKKGIRYLLLATRILIDRGVPCRFRIVGYGALEDALRAETETLGLGDRVEFTGAERLEAIPGHLAAADFFVGPSIVADDGDAEGLPVAFIEAMASGLPVIVSDVPGVRDLVHDGKDGLVVPPRDPAALADAVARLLADAELRRRLALNAAATAAEYDWTRIAERFTKVFEERQA